MKAYILNIRYGIWENQLWFSGEDTEEAMRKWNDAKLEVDSIAKESEGNTDFTSRLTKYFAEQGFVRIQK